MVPPFVEDAEGPASARWSKWRENFDAYLAWKQIDDHEEKFRTLMMFGGPDVRKVIAKVNGVENPLDNRYRVAVNLLDDYFIPRVSKTYERQKFRQMTPMETEKLDTFVIRLKQQAAYCDFGDQTENMIVDQIVTTTEDAKLKRKCLEKDLTLIEVVSIGRTNESVKFQLSDWKHQGPAKSTPNLMNNFKSVTEDDNVLKISSRNYVQQRSRCTRCEGRHSPNDPACPARSQKCKMCGQVGHFGRCCLTKRRKFNKPSSSSRISPPDESRQPRTRRFVREIDSTSERPAETSPDEIFDLFHLGSGKRFVSVQVGGHAVKFVVDTGADEDVLCENDWITLKQAGFEAYSVRKGSQKTFNAYGSSTPLEVLGEVETELVCGNRQADTTLYVIAKGKCSLLSGNTAVKLGIIKFLQAMENRTFPNVVGKQ